MNTLKYLVIAMSVILIGGSLFLFSVIYKHSKNGMGECAYNSSNLKISGKVITSSVAENIMTLLVEDKEGKQSVNLVDLCTNQLKSSYNVVAE